MSTARLLTLLSRPLGALLVLIGALGGSAAQAQQPGPAQPDSALQDTVLQKALEGIARGFEGRAGVYVRHLPSGRTAALAADSLFPTASLIKVPIALAVFDQVEQGALAYDQALTFRDSLRYEAPEDLLVKVQDGAEVSLGEVAFLMLAVSDNTAALWLKQLLGAAADSSSEGSPRADSLFARRWGRGSAAVNDWLAAHGYDETRVNSGLAARRAAFGRYGWGQTTPREMAEMLVQIRQGEAVSPAASAALYRALTRSYWDGQALSQIPPTVQAASKQGWVSTSRSEVLLVNAPHGDYVLCVITADLADTSEGPGNAGEQLVRDVSRLVWNHFEPASDWQPPAGMERYR